MVGGGSGAPAFYEGRQQGHGLALQGQVPGVGGAAVAVVGAARDAHHGVDGHADVVALGEAVLVAEARALAALGQGGEELLGQVHLEGGEGLHGQGAAVAQERQHVAELPPLPVGPVQQAQRGAHELVVVVCADRKIRAKKESKKRNHKDQNVKNKKIDQ